MFWKKKKRPMEVEEEQRERKRKALKRLRENEKLRECPKCSAGIVDAETQFARRDYGIHFKPTGECGIRYAIREIYGSVFDALLIKKCPGCGYIWAILPHDYTEGDSDVAETDKC